MSNRPVSKTTADRFEAYLLGQLDDQAMDKLEEELRDDPQQAEECIAVMTTLAMVRELFRDQHQQAGELTKDPTLQSFHGLLGELSAMEEAAETQTVHWVGQVRVSRPLWQQWQFVIPNAIAALLAIAVVLIAALPGNTNTTTPSPITNAPSEPSSFGPVLNKHVATLTAERNAQWAEGALAQGSPMRAGQRFTLTQGFAEITTNHGAVAILEAPAAIELTNNQNAIQLHAGKLVGICETESSKGFVVRTPHLDVTDLGTRFGIVTSAHHSEVHVFTGEVRAQRVDQGLPVDDPVLVTASQSVSVDADARQLSATALSDTSRFAVTRRVEHPVANTGQRLVGSDQTDPNWLVTHINGKPLNQPAATQLFTPPASIATRADLRFHANTPDHLGWITIAPAISGTNDKSYTYQTRFDSGDLDPASLLLYLRFRADNYVADIRLNGRSVTVPKQKRRPPFDTLVLSRIDSGFVPGENTLEITIHNVRHSKLLDDDQNHSALIAELTLTGVRDWWQAPEPSQAGP